MTNGRSSAASATPPAAPAATRNASRLLRISLLCAEAAAARGGSHARGGSQWLHASKIDLSCIYAALQLLKTTKLGLAKLKAQQLAACKALASSCVRVGQQFCALLYPSANGSPQQESLRPVHTAEASRSRGLHDAALCNSCCRPPASKREAEQRTKEHALAP